ncbi:hypothetical protein C8R45DRAFT_183356 [Mycena sanguinolenta]|nr:hypothetical protein C8R45DRAFT_183356 [Mycena sanguinolenta]
MASSHELQDFIDSALTDYASTTRSIGTRSPEVAPRTRRRRRTPLERAQAAVASLSLRDFNVLFQEMFVLRLASETLANGLPTEPARPSCSQASTASQGGPVGYGWPNSDHHPSSISAAALPPTSLANSFCGPDHDPELQTHRQLVDTRASTSTQDFVGSSSNFPQHPPPIYPQASGSSPTAPQGGPMGYGWRNSDHHLSSTSAAALSPTSLDNSSRGPGHDHQLETHRQLVNTRASTLTQDFAGSSSNYPQPTFPMYPQASGWLPHSIAPIPPRYCALCGTNHTPQWRKHPVLGSYVCNKCGHGDNFKDRPNKRKREHE